MNPTLYRGLQRGKHLAFRKTVSRLEREEWLSRDQLADIAWERQKALVRHAYAHSPFYRHKYDAAGFHPDRLRNPDDFARVPVLTKTEVREHIADMICDDVSHARLVRRLTSGSTGVPLMIYHDRMQAPVMHALYSRIIGRWGLKVGCKTALIWGIRRPYTVDTYKKSTRWERFLRNSVTLDAHDIMTAERMTRFARLLRDYRPDLIISYVSAMAAFARFLDEGGTPDFRPGAMWLSAEPTHSFQKELIERVFRSTVYNVYGSVEIDRCAAECDRREGLHINADLRTVEVVDKTGLPLPTGEIGELIVTDLTNHAAPLIRYRIEDLGSLLEHDCSCGRRLPLMGKVAGRVIDMFVLPDGSQIYGGGFATFFYDRVKEVRSFQVHQTDRNKVIVRVVPTATCEREDLRNQLLRTFGSYTSGKMQFDIQFVDRIDQEASGKFRYVKSDVTHRISGQL